MAKTILVAGKDMPFGESFVDGLSSTGRNIVVTRAETEAEELKALEKKTAAEKKAEAAAIEEAEAREASSGIFSVAWNRPSSVSARTLVLQAENAYGSLDEAVLYFDEDFYASNAEKTDAAECVRGCDELIVPYQVLALEVLARYEKKYDGTKPFTLVFMLKEGPSVADSVRSPAIKNGQNAIASPVVSAAAAAFATFAENIAAVYGDASYVNIVLVHGDGSNEIARNDSSLASWLSEFMDSVSSLKTKLNAKKSLAWNKVGAKSAGGFSLFRL